MAFPSIDEALAVLTTITEAEQPLTASTKLLEADVDSLDVFEWVFELGLPEDALDAEELMAEIESLTLGDVYEQLVAAATSTTDA